MSSSLTSRLREGRNIPLGEPWELVNEAADRIEELTKLCEELRLSHWHLSEALAKVARISQKGEDVEAADRIKKLESTNREYSFLRSYELARIKQLETALRDVVVVAEAEYSTLTGDEHGSLFQWHEPFQRAHRLLKDAND